MPLIETSTYRAPLLLFNGHVQTIFPTLFRKVHDVSFTRERITTPDDDFLDLDWLTMNASSKLVILSHGLEGNTSRAYVRGMAKRFHEEGWNILAWNYRGCSGESNRLLRSYHSGATEDLEIVIHHGLSRGYTEIVLIGFSLGGNMTLKYLGEKGNQVHPAIRKAVTFSVPVDLKSSALTMESPACRIYMRRFLRMLHEKIKLKSTMFPGQISDTGFSEIKTFRQFDDRYTAPLHGFRDAEDYWSRCSAVRFLDKITIPTLLVNAQNDPFLGPSCFPITQVQHHTHITLEMPRTGGHVGFPASSKKGYYWSEERALLFTNEGV